MDVVFPNGKTFLLIIETDSYSGNFDRELVAFSTGIYDLEYGFGQDEAEEAELANSGMVASFESKSLELFDRRKHYNILYSLYPTKGRVNICGAHLDADEVEEGVKTYPAFESVAIFFSVPLNEDEISFITERAQKYGTVADRPFNVKRVFQIQIETIQQIIETEL